MEVDIYFSPFFFVIVFFFMVGIKGMQLSNAVEINIKFLWG